MSATNESEKSEFIPTFLDKNHQFDDYSNVGDNGYFLQNIYLPEEILLHILSYVDPKQLLNYSLVCHNWKTIIRSNRLWFIIYERQYKRKPKNLPWYLYYALLATNYFDTNLLTKKDQVKQWNEAYTFSNEQDSEEICVADLNISAKKLFVLYIRARQTVRFRGRCPTGRRHYKLQWLIKIEKNTLLQHILDVYKPHISLTKWASMYDLQLGYILYDELNCILTDCYGTEHLGDPCFIKWLDVIVTQYSKGIEGILLEQLYCGQDSRYAKKGSVKLLFDSIQPVDDDDIKNSISLSNIKFMSEIHPLELEYSYLSDDSN